MFENDNPSTKRDYFHKDDSNGEAVDDIVRHSSKNRLVLECHGYKFSDFCSKHLLPYLFRRFDCKLFYWRYPSQLKLRNCTYLLGSLGTLIFRMGSLHTLSNFLIMCYTIPAFYKGLSRDFQRYVLRRNIIPGVTNVHVILVSTSHKSPSLPFRSVLKATRHSTHPANSWERTTTNSRI